MFNYKNFKIFTEQGSVFNYQYSFRKVPFVSLDLYRKIFKLYKKKVPLKHKIIYKCFKAQNLILSFLIYFNISIYNGKNHISFNFNKLKYFKKLGSFRTTRIVGLGKTLHLRKKNIKKKK